MKRRSMIIFLCLLCFGSTESQEVFDVRTIAFYNLENLFDTVNDTTHFDDDRTADGSARWTLKRYARKLESLAKVISSEELQGFLTSIAFQDFNSSQNRLQGTYLANNGIPISPVEFIKMRKLISRLRG